MNPTLGTANLKPTAERGAPKTFSFKNQPGLHAPDPQGSEKQLLNKSHEDSGLGAQGRSSDGGFPGACVGEACLLVLELCLEGQASD